MLGLQTVTEKLKMDSLRLLGRIVAIRLTVNQYIAGSNPAPTAKGRVAQLGERLLCKQEVGGSSPSTSTKIFPFGNQLTRLVPTDSGRLGVVGSPHFSITSSPIMGRRLVQAT